MRKRTIYICLLLLLVAPAVYLLSNNEQLNQRTEEAIELYRDASDRIIKMLLDDNTVVCSPSIDFQNCLESNVSKVIYTKKGLHDISPFNLYDGQRLVVRAGTILRLSSDITMPYKDGYVMGIMGDSDKEIVNVTVLFNGEINGNKKIHPYEQSGNECVRVDYANHLTFVGSGILRDCSGDGLDIDVSDNIFISGISAIDNSGAGFHIGSGRPISSSKNILALGLIAEGNGHKLQRAGLDVSWPNQNSNIYMLSAGRNNYRNWELEGAGSFNILSISSNAKKVDTLHGASFTLINGKQNSSFLENYTYLTKLVVRDLKLFYQSVSQALFEQKEVVLDYKGNPVGRVPDYLLPLRYVRQ